MTNIGLRQSNCIHMYCMLAKETFKAGKQINYNEQTLSVATVDFIKPGMKLLAKQLFNDNGNARL